MKEKLKSERDRFYTQVLLSLNDALKTDQFFGGMLSVADIQYYCEISTVVELCNREISKQDQPALHNWFYNTMRQRVELTELDKELKQAIAANTRNE